MSIFHTHIVMPLAEPELHAGLASRLRAIRRFERMPEKRQREQHHTRLRSLLEHAYATVPFYRKQFDDACFDPSNLRPGEPIPIASLSHDVLRERLRVSASPAGPPSTPWEDREAARNKAALGLQLDHRAGYEAGDSVLMLQETSSSPSAESAWKAKFYKEVLMRRTAAPCATLSGEVLEGEVLEQLRIRYEKQRPKVLGGSATALAAFASHLRQHGMHHRVQVVIATADALSDRQRNLIESVFGLRMYVRYTCQGIGAIAAECPDHEGLHFHPWGSFVEFEPIASTSQGTICRLVVTDLLNYSEPLIRCDSGDCVILAEQPCSCGSWFPLAEKILGSVGQTAERPQADLVRAAWPMHPATAIAQRLSVIAWGSPFSRTTRASRSSRLSG